MSSPVWLVARREIRERVRARSFRIGTVVSALIVVAVIAIPASRKGHISTYRVGVVDAPTAATVGEIQRLAGTLHVHLVVRAVASADDARALIRQKQLDVAAVGDRELLVKEPPAPEDAGKKPQLINAVGLTVRLQALVARLGPAALETAVALRQPVPVHGVEKPAASAGQRLTAFFGVLILFIFLQQYGTWVLNGVVEEKSSRVVEVLLAAIKPRQLVAGKVIGVGAVALFQGFTLVVVALVTARAVGSELLHGAAQGNIVWTFAWFIVGYAFYSWAYAAVGSLVNRQSDGQNAAFPLMVPLLVGYITTTSLIGAGDPSPFARVLSFFPATAPVVMPMILGIGKATAWQSAIAMAITIAAVFVLIRVAGMVYARAVLHTGRRLKLSEVLSKDFASA
ncbi:MAG: ABC transporter permease [Actinobacteria bacterium]|nr:ABC transporter permease [Actinomycetota bacterium]